MYEGHADWIGGGFFIGVGKVLLGWVREYRAAVERMMGEGLKSQEQDVIYAMHNTMAPKTQLQLYQGTRGGNGWFHLGYLA